MLLRNIQYLLSFTFVAYFQAAVYTLPLHLARNNLTDISVGLKVVEDVLAQLNRSKMFPDDYGFMRRIALVESQFGTAMTREGGIWQISPYNFTDTKITSGRTTLTRKLRSIRELFNITWLHVKYEELEVNPFYSALATRLYISLDPESIPKTIEKQAVYWNKAIYEGSKSFQEVKDFIRKVYEFEEGEYIELDSMVGESSTFLSSKKLAIIGTGALVLIAAMILAGLYRWRIRRQRQLTAHSDQDLQYPILSDGPTLAIENFEFHSTLGEGHFGEVRRFVAKNPNGKEEIQEIAVKTAKDLKSEELLRNEAAIMTLAGSHQYVAAFLGYGVVPLSEIPDRKVHYVCQIPEKGELFFIALECHSGRTLKDYLIQEYKHSDNNVDVMTPPTQTKYKKLLEIAMKISEGMAYLHRRGILHRDLATRNILLTSELDPKISDFGLSRKLKDPNSYYSSKDPEARNIPWQSSAPEWLKTRCFYLESDVWSFGIVFWEMLAFGNSPYSDWGITGNDPGLRVMLERLNHGQRLKTPAWARSNESIVNILTSCWELEHHNRPSFEKLVKRFLNLIRE